MMALVVVATAAAAAAPLERLERVDAWLADGASPPPRHWAVRGPGDVAAASTFLAGKGQKDVRASRLADGGAPVVVKALHKAGAFRFGDRASDIAYLELLYLEFLRGEPGVPELLGGWATATSVVWVVRDAGRAVAAGTGSSRSPAVFAAAYDARARADPLGLATAWLRCFRSFAERGGFVLTDFKVDQFTLGRDGEIYLVDGPAPNSGPVAAFARRHFTSGAPDYILTKDNKNTKPKHIDLEPGAAASCGEDRKRSATCGKRTYDYHRCDSDAACKDGVTLLGIPNSRSAPELTRCRDDKCEAFDWRVHVFDVARRAWILPRIIALAKDKRARKTLADVADRMAAARPEDRPTFDALLRELA